LGGGFDGEQRVHAIFNVLPGIASDNGKSLNHLIV
jgi:hypothetical protein